jgi:hypothetical protein
LIATDHIDIISFDNALLTAAEWLLILGDLDNFFRIEEAILEAIPQAVVMCQRPINYSILHITRVSA